MKVDLPEPEAPVTARYSPRSTVDADALQRADDAAAELVGLDQIAGDDLSSGGGGRLTARRVYAAHCAASLARTTTLAPSGKPSTISVDVAVGEA